jgi:6-phosphogluconolactonase
VTVYAGTYTGDGSKGIYAYRFDDSTGKLTATGLAAETSNPSFLAVSPNQRFLYAANEEADAGGVSAFSIDAAAGTLTLLNAVSSRGAAPCHVAIDKTGKRLFVANYNSGSAAAFPVHADGTLGEAAAFVQHSGSSVNPQRQAGPHAHSVNVSPDNRFLLVADLGLDQIITYRIEQNSPLTPANPPFTKVAPGSGPRHLAFSPDGRFAYAINEMLATVTVFQYDAAAGSLREAQTIATAPAGFNGANSGAEIAVHPSGKFVYASNRGHDSVAIFRVDAATGRLTSAGWVSTQGKTPRNFAIDPSGKFLLAANQDSGNIVVFRIDQATGGLTPAGVEVKVAAPVSIVFAAFAAR